MGYIKRKCDNCGKEYMADERNLKRGWGLCCSKSCAAQKREKSKPNYNPERVAANNIRRANWVENGKDIWARKRGYPDFETYERDADMEDASWDAHGGIELAICDICGLRSDYCTCGEGNDPMYDDNW